MNAKPEAAHLRITVETTFNGKIISTKEIEENSEIAKLLPDNNSVQQEYQKILKLADGNMNSYVINVSEHGISSKVVQDNA